MTTTTQTDQMTTAGAEGGSPPGGSRRSSVPRILPAGSATTVGIVLVMVIYGVWLGGDFLNASSRMLDMHQVGPQLLLALAVLCPLFAGSFDLSVTSVATLSTFLIVGMRVQHDWPTWAVIVLALIVGVVAGIINGYLVEYLNINAFIATLGTGSLFAGISAVYSQGQQIGPAPGTPELAGWFTGQGSFGSYTGKLPTPIGWIIVVLVLCAVGYAVYRRVPESMAKHTKVAVAVSIPVVIGIALTILGLNSWIGYTSWMIAFVLLVTFVLWVLMDLTMFGRYLKATGSNRVAASLSGIPARRMVMSAFVMSGVLGAIAGILLSANLGAASPDVAAPLLLPAFAAAFVSTVLLSNGKFTVWGTVAGAVVLVWIAQGLVIGGLEFTWIQIINGMVLLLAVALSTYKRVRA